jgi:glycosyltransferase involved in cell wall biosynthesis
MHKAVELGLSLRVGRSGYVDSDEFDRSGPWVISGFFSDNTGIGRAGRLSRDNLIAASYNPLCHDLSGIQSKLLKAKADLPGTGGYWLIHANPPEAAIALQTIPKSNWINRYRIGYWAWETSSIPNDWARMAPYFHEIWVPSQYVKDVVIKGLERNNLTSLQSRLNIVPHPLPPKPLISKSEARHKFGLLDNKLNCLCLFNVKSSLSRKNPWGAIDAWLQAFPLSSSSAHLTIKISGASENDKNLIRLKEIEAQRSDISLLFQSLSDEDMSSFILGFDALLSLHRSEGYGLGLAEALNLGLSVIATGYSGNLDFMTDKKYAKQSHLIDYKLIKLNDNDGHYAYLTGKKDQFWAEPNIGSAAKALVAIAKTFAPPTVR